MKKIFLAIFLLVGLQAASQTQLKWMSFEEAVAANEQNPKKIFIDVYTDWCGWCKVMDKQTFTDSAVIAAMNKYFYPVKFNAQSRTKIKFSGQDFGFNARNNAHDLAVALLRGQMSYPSTVYMDGKNRVITAVPGFQKPENIMPILIYMGEGLYETQPWEEFQKEYQARKTPKTIETL
ncbi:MAG: DUF255 domain-containing protein [Prevotellaceae bacterium]|jgi:thioredoxin-related protein|nr:DUF255 domain-containing protein [Prevotellaceae bacterium]